MQSKISLKKPINSELAGSFCIIHVFCVALAEVIVKFRDKIRSLEKEVKSILKQEDEEKQLRVSEMEVNKARNMIEHEQEIFSRPAKTWIPSSNQKSGTEVKKAAKKEKRKKPETVLIMYTIHACIML